MPKYTKYTTNTLVAIIITALSLTVLPALNLPYAQAVETSAAETLATEIPQNARQLTDQSTNQLTDQPAISESSVTSENPAISENPLTFETTKEPTVTNNLADPPPAPRNVAVTQPDLTSLRVTWTAPDNPPADYTYTIELYNNVNAVAVTKTDIPQTDSEYLFNNLPANNYT
ncbi:MAG: fibronectin type III domain-containing protein, partial [Bifidobacteriaceae bacterium]|nr:fibronectin type III domain-containing protein [Bifidobacteriaceae bacterium]